MREEQLIKFIICSGGQIGVDQGVIEAVLGKKTKEEQSFFKIEGIAPLGFITADGNGIPNKYRKFLKEDETFRKNPLLPEDDNYSSRTKMNIINSDATLILVPENFAIRKDPETLQTIKIVKELKKPNLVISLSENNNQKQNNINKIIRLIEKEEILKLNITGPRETNFLGIFDKTLLFMSDFLEEVKSSRIHLSILEKWEKLHPDFSKEISEKVHFETKNNKIFLQKWREKGINYQEAKLWIEMGFEPFEKFTEMDYTCLPSHWKDNYFEPTEVQNLLKKLKKNDYNFALYLKNKHGVPKNVLDSINLLAII